MLNLALQNMERHGRKIKRKKYDRLIKPLADDQPLLGPIAREVADIVTLHRTKRAGRWRPFPFR
jgi:hypothetical protein